MFLRNGLEPGHLLVLGLVLILLFGSKKLPETARSLGRSLRIFKNETTAMRADVTTADVTPAGADSPATGTGGAAALSGAAAGGDGPAGGASSGVDHVPGSGAVPGQGNGATRAEGGPARADEVR
ncbi:twin-arginine translocase TatA/TatE family subunit [Microtetraspora niveoalba]|uniref:twin-arginine translocase TatA/TatE family subunit n=1 Tax=Microtetraspora niveoalba TaxID=46175 RepID=UPI00082FC4DD|nr:twin-arginine translocase TatA/TatE family subunit [Microtetraspora niveoalba]